MAWVAMEDKQLAPQLWLGKVYSLMWIFGEAEFDANCVQNAKDKGKMDGAKILMGDPTDPIILETWVGKSGGKFDLVIDKGVRQS